MVLAAFWGHRVCQVWPCLRSGGLDFQGQLRPWLSRSPAPHASRCRRGSSGCSGVHCADAALEKDPQQLQLVLGADPLLGHGYGIGAEIEAVPPLLFGVSGRAAASAKRSPRSSAGTLASTAGLRTTATPFAALPSTNTAAPPTVLRRLMTRSPIHTSTTSATSAGRRNDKVGLLRTPHQAHRAARSMGPSAAPLCNSGVSVIAAARSSFSKISVDLHGRGTYDSRAGGSGISARSGATGRTCRQAVTFGRDRAAAASA